ncbi:MAG: hypothetical protein Q7U03_09355 [Syntrophales bacterium]|nr:hypothetical protein [Syntrophales bacterium]
MNKFISFFLLALMVLAPLQGQCEDWKEYFNDGVGTFYYDKDSIHYPEQKKILGFTVKNKEIVNVWTKIKYRASGENDTQLTRIYCLERECMNCAGMVNLFSKELSGRKEPIEPGSWGESLLKKVCP